jgi:hypothetical protein
MASRPVFGNETARKEDLFPGKSGRKKALQFEGICIIFGKMIEKTGL